MLVEALKARPSSLAIITDSNNKSLEIIKKNLSELNLIDFYDFGSVKRLDSRMKR